MVMKAQKYIVTTKEKKNVRLEAMNPKTVRDCTLDSIRDILQGSNKK